MPVSFEYFVQQLEDSGIIAADTIRDFIPPKTTLKDAEELARELVRNKKLTKFQAEEVYKGKAKSLVLGNYLLLEKIGEGSSGQVYKARHQLMDRIVAIKLLAGGLCEDPSLIARFEREVKAAAKLNHPNIVAAFDAVCANEIQFLVMEFVDGCDLSNLVKKCGALPASLALNYLLQAARGLQAAHAAGIIHRDIKPANLLLDKKGVVKVLDMSIARLTADANRWNQVDLTLTGAIMGTVNFMAPEQALDSKLADARSDIYALGCSLYYFLTGQAAYQGDTIMTRLLAHREKPIPSLRTVRPEISERLDAAFSKMIAKKPEDRFQTVAELIAELEECARLQGPSADAPQQLAGTIYFPDINSATESQLDLFVKGNVSQPPSNPSVQVTQLPPRNRGRSERLFGIGMFGVLLLIFGMMFTVKTKDGTLVVTVNEPDADVQVLDQVGKIEVTRKGDDKPISIAVDPGKHRLKVAKDGFEFFAKDFEVASGGKIQITAMLVPQKPSRADAVGQAGKDKLPVAMDDWVKEAARLPAESMLNAVLAKLQELNPGFDGKNTHRIDTGVLTALSFSPEAVSDISPLSVLKGLKSLVCVGRDNNKFSGRLVDLSPIRGLPIANLDLRNNMQLSNLEPLVGMPLIRANFFMTAVADLEPLRNMKLLSLNIGGTKVTDLGPLSGMPLTSVGISGSTIIDLSGLQGLPLTRFECYNTKVDDLAPLKNLKLTSLNFHDSNVTDLTPLTGMPLEELVFYNTKVFDLSPIKELKLTQIDLRKTPVVDLSALGKMNLKTISFSPFNIISGIDVIREMPSVTSIAAEANGATKTFMPRDFWAKYDAGDFGKPIKSKTK